MPIVSQGELIERLGLGEQLSSEMLQRIDEAIVESVELVQWYCRREFVPTAGVEARSFDGAGTSTVFIDDLLVVESIAIGRGTSASEITLDDVVWKPANELPKTWFYAPGYTFPNKPQIVQVEAKWGFYEDEPPSVLRRAVRDLAARLFRTKPSGALVGGVASESFGGGTTVSYKDDRELAQFAPEECMLLSRFKRYKVHIGAQL